jgi:hypothetical protein
VHEVGGCDDLCATPTGYLDKSWFLCTYVIYVAKRYDSVIDDLGSNPAGVLNANTDIVRCCLFQTYEPTVCLFVCFPSGFAQVNYPDILIFIFYSQAWYCFVLTLKEVGIICISYPGKKSTRHTGMKFSGLVRNRVHRYEISYQSVKVTVRRLSKPWINVCPIFFDTLGPS